MLCFCLTVEFMPINYHLFVTIFVPSCFKHLTNLTFRTCTQVKHTLYVVATGTSEEKVKNTGRKLVRFLSEEEIDALIDVSKGNDLHHAIIQVLYMTGLRVSELASLKTDVLRTNQEMINIVGKGGRERLVPFPPIIRDVLNKLPFGAEYIFAKKDGHLSRQAILSIVKRLAKQAGIRQTVTPHQLRHSFATHMMERGADLITLMTLLGHSDVSTTERYLWVRTKHLIETVKKHPLAEGKI